MENNNKKREWIKNAIIIFLIVMLILTLFSNTIMNYSLPEVTAQYTWLGQITHKVRGNGIVETADPYSVVIKEARKIDSVAVKPGDTVAKGDTLYVLADGESEELKTEIEALEKLENEYESAVITGEISRSTTNAVESGNTGTLASNQAKLESAKSSVEGWEKKVESIKKQQELAGLDKQYKDSTEDLKDEKAKWDAQNISDETTLSSAKSSYETAQDAYVEANAVFVTAQSDYNAAEAAYTNAKTIYDDAIAAGFSDAAVLDVSAAELNVLEGDRDTKKDTFTSAQTSVNVASSLANERKAAYDKAASDAAYSAQMVKYYEDAIKNAGHAANDKDYNLAKQLSDAEAGLEKAKKYYEDLKTELANMYGLEDKLKAINDQKAKVEKMKADSVGGTITAPVDGIILTMKYVAGETIETGSEVATIQKAGKGFTISMSVTKEQAKYVSVGDEAEVANSWWYSDLHARVLQIRPDQTNPNGGKTIIFEVEGEDLVSGQSLSLTVGNKTAGYDVIVPNSAVHEDNKGKYIYKIESKNTPFGNRYIARRVDVTVLAEGDNESAVSGTDLLGWDYIIETFSKPLEDGRQVRLKD